MIYKFKDEVTENTMEVEAVREKVQITFFGKNEDNGIDLEPEELQKLINALISVASEIKSYKESVAKNYK